MAEKDLYKFDCGYCGNKFEQYVSYITKGTSKVKCPNCENFLKNKSGIKVNT